MLSYTAKTRNASEKAEESDVRDRLLQPVSRSQRVLSTQLISLQLMVLRLFRTTSSPKFRRFTVCRVLISTISTSKLSFVR